MDNLLQKDKNLIYKGKSYPIDFILLTRRSHFFFEKLNDFNKVQNIEISDNGLEISEDVINDFISFCQFEQKKIDITNSNVFSLHQLAIKYNVPGLIKITNNYIAENHKDLVIQSLYYNYQNNQPDKDDEIFISKHFFDYINNSLLPKLPIPIIYRILNNTNINKIDDMDDQHQQLIFNFLFQCLDEHKRAASILFKNFELDGTEIINRLLNEYNDIFDFNMINSKITVKKIPEMLNEINKLKYENTKFLSDAQNKLNFFMTKINELTNIIHVQSEEILELKETINRQKKEMNDQTDDIKQNIVNDKTEILHEISILKEELNNIKNNVAQHETEQKSFVTINQLRDILQAGREKTRSIEFWVCGKTYTNDKKDWSNGPAYIGDNLNYWINNKKNLHWRAYEPWDAAISLVPK